MPRLRLALILLVCVSPSPAADDKKAPDAKKTVELRVLPGEQLSGELVSIDDQKVLLRTEKELKPVPVASVLLVNLQPPPALTPANKCIEVELTDGSLLRCKPDGVALKGKQVQLTLLSGLKVEVPLSVLSYILKDAQDPKLRDHADWKKLLKERRNQDVIAQWREQRIDSLAGSFTDGTGTKINMTHESGASLSRDLTHSAVQGFIFVNKPDPQAPLTLCKVQDLHHNLLMVASVVLKEKGEFQLTTVAGAKLAMKPEAVASLDYSKEKLVYLSDLEATVLEEPSPEFRFGYRYRRDKNLDNKELRLGDDSYKKSLSLPAPTVLVYKIGGDYKEFTTVVGIDESVGGKSNVEFMVEGGGQVLYKTEVRRGKDKPPKMRIKLPIQNVQELRLSVRSLELVDIDNPRVDLGNPMITK